MSMISPEIKARSIGAILVEAGHISVIDAERILRLQKVKGLRFGEAAIQLGMVSEQDVEFALASQFDYPYLIRQDATLSDELVAAYAPFSTEVETLRDLRSQLMLRYFAYESSPRTVAIVSPGVNEGKSFLCANLAVVFSQLGEKTLLIDANMRSPRQHELFGLSNSAGLSSVLSGRGGLEDSVRISSLLNLQVLPSGPIPPNPQELIGRDQFQRLLDEACVNFDVVLVDTPAATVYSEAKTIAVRSRGAILAARKNVTRSKSVKACSDAIFDLGGSVIGSVLNCF